MHAVLYDALPREAAAIRTQIFMDEQGFQQEFDEMDARAGHLVLWDKDVPVATCRFFADPQRKGTYLVGRIAVVRARRGQGLGSRMLAEAEGCIRKRKGSRVALHAQQRAVEFYEKQGYRVCSGVELDEGCPHVWMEKSLAEE